MSGPPARSHSPTARGPPWRRRGSSRLSRRKIRRHSKTIRLSFAPIKGGYRCAVPLAKPRIRKKRGSAAAAAPPSPRDRAGPVLDRDHRPHPSAGSRPGRPSPAATRSSRSSGKGGMGRVYKVFDTEVQEKIALKLLNPEIASDEQTIERFRNELKLARKISHRNVCRMYDLGRAKIDLLHHHGVRARRGPEEPHPPDRASCRAARPSASPARSARAWPRPTARRRPPRPQAPEHHDRPGRQRPDHGFRHRPLGQGQGDHRRRTSSSARPSTCRPSRWTAKKRTRARTSTRWASSSTRW